MSLLDCVVFVVENNKVVERTISSFDNFIEETTTPLGVAPKMHVRGNELWSWGHQGNFPRLIRSFETAEESQEALEETFLSDFWDCPEITAFCKREDAEDFLRQLNEE